IGIFLSVTVFAGIEPVSNRISGSQLYNNALIMVQDDKYPSTAFPGSVVENYPSFSKVKKSIGKVLFGIDHGSDVYTSTDFKLKLELDVTAYDKNGTLLLNHVSKTLTIDY